MYYHTGPIILDTSIVTSLMQRYCVPLVSVHMFVISNSNVFGSMCLYCWMNIHRYLSQNTLNDSLSKTMHFLFESTWTLTSIVSCINDCSINTPDGKRRTSIWRGLELKRNVCTICLRDWPTSRFPVRISRMVGTLLSISWLTRSRCYDKICYPFQSNIAQSSYSQETRERYTNYVKYACNTCAASPKREIGHVEYTGHKIQ